MNGGKRTDGNQKALVLAFHRFGASVQSLHTVGKGCPDLVVGFRGKTFLVEVKLPNGKLNKMQREFHAAWNGHPIEIARNLEDMPRILGLSEKQGGISDTHAPKDVPRILGVDPQKKIV